MPHSSPRTGRSRSPCWAPTTSPSRATSSTRRTAWAQALAEAGLPEGICVEADFSAESGAAATRTLLDLPTPPTAIVYANDLMAVAGISLAVSRGFPVPDRLSVTGFDDVPLASDVTPRLATLALPHAASGARAVEMALADTGGLDGREPLREVVVGTFIARESCAPRR